MTYSFRCPETGILDICDGPVATCSTCGKEHTASLCGRPVTGVQDGPVVSQVQTYKTRWNNTHKKFVTSRKQEDALDASKGICTVTEREARDMSPPPDTTRYPGRDLPPGV
jgi:hypothetical protein